MRNLLFVTFLFQFPAFFINAQDQPSPQTYKKSGVVWSAGVFKAWLKDNDIGFNKIGDRITPVFTEENKSGFAIQSHYMFKPNNWFGIGAHAGIGIDISSFIEAPVLLFGLSLSFGSQHQFIIDFGLADGKRKVVPEYIMNDILNTTLTEIPEIFDHTEFNTGYYIGLSYRIFTN